MPVPIISKQDAQTSGIPRPKSTYTLRRRPSLVLAPSTRNHINTATHIHAPSVPPIPTAQAVKGLAVKPALQRRKSALSAPAVRLVRPVQSNATAGGQGVAAVPAVKATTAYSSLTAPRSVRKMPSIRTLSSSNTPARVRPKLPGAGGGASSAGLDIGAAQTVAMTEYDCTNATTPANHPKPTASRLSNGALQRKASRPSLRRMTSRPSLGKAERILPASGPSIRAAATEQAGARGNAGLNGTLTPGRTRLVSNSESLGGGLRKAVSIAQLKRLPTITRSTGQPFCGGGVGAGTGATHIGSEVPAVPAIPAKHLRPAIQPRLPSQLASRPILPPRSNVSASGDGEPIESDTKNEASISSTDNRANSRFSINPFAPLPNTVMTSSRNAPTVSPGRHPATAASSATAPVSSSPAVRGLRPRAPPDTNTVATPLMPRIRNISTQRSKLWDSSMTYSPLGNVQLSFDGDLDSDSDLELESGPGVGPDENLDMPTDAKAHGAAKTESDIADEETTRGSEARLRPPPARARLSIAQPANLAPSENKSTGVPISDKTAELQDRIAQLEAQLLAQSEAATAAMSDRRAALEAQNTFEQRLQAIEIDKTRSEALAVKRQYENAVSWGKTIRDDLAAQLSLIRALKGVRV